jgi:diguanylate cyclase (GGDEF)-like protein
MVKILNYLFEGKPRGLIFLYSLMLVLFDGAVDFITGYELTYFIFYVLPVMLAAWYGNRGMAWIISLLSALVWLFVDIIDAHPYSHDWYAYWNGGVRFSFFILITKLITAVRTRLEFEKTLARVDELTDAPNRLAFREKCDVLFPLASRKKTPMALGFIDIDDFSNLNDKHGHGFGDEVLRTVANILKDNMRKSDVFGRIFGNEFAVLLPNTDPDTARKIFAELHLLLSEKARMEGWPIGFSIGVAVIENPDISTDQAMEFADGLVHLVKKSEKSSLLCQEYDRA